MSISMKTGSQQQLAARFFLILAMLFVTVAFPLSAHASAGDGALAVNSLPPLKSNTLLSEKDFDAQTKKLSEVSPYNDPLLSYSIRIPADWTDNVQKAPISSGEGSMLSRHVMGQAARYVGAPKNLLRSYLSVEAQVLQYEISARSWFVNFMTRAGVSLTALTEKGPNELEAMYVQVERDQAYAVRVRALLNGPNMVLVRYYLPQENYEQEKVLQEQVVSSFTFLSPTNAGVENRVVYGFLDQSYFDYPASWELRERSILSVERMSATLFQQREELDGRKKRLILEGHIKINVVSRLLNTTLAQEITAFREGLNIPDYTIGDLIEDVPYKYDPSIKSGRAQIYALVPKGEAHMQHYEYLVTVMEGDDYYYITSMVTPSRQQEFHIWSQNMAAAKVVNESMRRNQASSQDNMDDPYYDYLKNVQ